MLNKLKKYFEVKIVQNDCIFCKIVNKEIESKIVAENNFAIAFMDIAPFSDGHILVIPKKHYLDLATCDLNYLKQVIELVQSVSKKIEASSLQPWGFNYLSNQGSIAGQVVNHFHMHIIPKYAKNEGFEFGSPNKQIGNIDEIYNKIMKSKFKIE